MPLGDRIKEAFVRSYSVLKSMAAKMVGESDAEDVVQDAFIRLWQSKSSFREEAKIETYLVQAVKNQAIISLRKKNSSIDGITFSYDTLSDGDKPSSHRDLLINTIKAAEPKETPYHANTAELSESDKNILKLRQLGKKWYLRAPEVLGISPGNARVKFSRLSDKLRRNTEAV